MTEDNICSDPVDVDVLICTYQRPSVAETLRSIEGQKLPAGVTLRVIVADNDVEPSAAASVEAACEAMSVPVVYLHAPARNISIARNACLDRADAAFVAFIDDDEWAASDWIASLLAKAESGDYHGVFGPVLAAYGDDTPKWIKDRDYLSTWPMTRGGELQTGYTGNALLRWNSGPFRQSRFRLDKGRTGGEDTEFFFRLWRTGARFAIADRAIVREAVEPARLDFEWIRKRKYRAGQSYGRHVAEPTMLGAVSQLVMSAAKIASCAVMAGLSAFSASHRRYWILRGAFHYGVFAASLGGKESISYGQ